jgi:hypothetical protein
VSEENDVSGRALRTPKAAAIAGVVFSLLTLASFGALFSAIPADPLAPPGWLAADARAVNLALNLIPFAGIAFLWFIGVIRDRLGRREDRFFATVFFGSGLLFIGTLFVAAAVLGAIVIASGSEGRRRLRLRSDSPARSPTPSSTSTWSTWLACS